MNEKIKMYVGGAAVIGMLAVSYAAISYVGTYAESIEPSSFRSFSVTADAKVVGVPDVAAFTASVITEGGTDLGTLQETNVERTNKVIAYIKGQGVDEKDVKTEGYAVEPRYETCNYSVYSQYGGTCPPPKIVGYTVRQTVSVKIRDFSKAGDILAGVVKEGANSVSSLNFTVDDPTELQNEARAKAIEKAKAKAEAIADAGGFSVGRLLGIDESGTAPRPYYKEEYGMGGAGDVSATMVPSIEPGSEDITVTVTLRYEIR